VVGQGVYGQPQPHQLKVKRLAAPLTVGKPNVGFYLTDQNSRLKETEDSSASSALLARSRA
jgi:hypothetical protein